ncbi:SWEET sugar transporter [Caenorhabditis elegans]|uniref:SWEET sugar transporter n=1 Tax=Caenorhabditis elegans TaxID=6239 RepID=G5EGC1_CAEEL|nr:SWEET sugar transporter [Caenorhabditis elegans]CAH04703.1 SWEET sugar transporter [Caenorhabditis elegans]|eukprot:NP_001021080.1 Uncharacterized protein CELE_DY3.8 [Caenorhabditis elegans]
MIGAINVAGLLFSVYFYAWLRPDLQANVRMGFYRYKVDFAIYFGTAVWLFLAMCVVAPRVCRRTNAIAGNCGMAVCSIIVIVNHYLLEKKWVWGGLLYLSNIMFYVLFMGLTVMGQFSRYHYDKNRVSNMIIPILANAAMTVLLMTNLTDTGYSDVVPIISYGVHTTMAIIAQGAGPRLKTLDFFEYLNQFKRRQ